MNQEEEDGESQSIGQENLQQVQDYPAPGRGAGAVPQSAP
jgi:hypothetical protein